VRIIGHGIDFIDTQRIERLLNKHPDRFIERVFTEAERRYCELSPARRVEHYAARFAAKEAALKALGTGLSRGIQWTEVEVIRMPSGQPALSLAGKAGLIASDLGIEDWSLSISHVKTHAVASAIGTGG